MNDATDKDQCICNARYGVDYYGVLSLTKSCNDVEIKEAYRHLAIRHHPKRKQHEGNCIVFALIAEAYDVLSDPLRRAVYDQYGEEGLKRGVPGPEGFIEPYIFHGEPLRTYRLFFGTENPYADLLDVLKRPLYVLDYPEGRGIKRKEEPLIKPLLLSLTEIFFGGLKKMKIHREVLGGVDKSVTECNEKILSIPIQPGLPTGTRIIFPGEGDQGPAKSPADIVFITEDRPHETFQRDGSDLHMVVDIFLKDALTGTIVTINTIDDRVLRVPITCIITPDYRKIVPGEGLPIPENPKERGNLILRFNVEFPIYLPSTGKAYIKRAFETPDSTSSTDAEYIHRLILADKMGRNKDHDIPLRHDPPNETEINPR